MVHPALRRCAAGQQVDGYTRRCHGTPTQTLDRLDWLHDERSTDRVCVVANYPRRTALRCNHAQHQYHHLIQYISIFIRHDRSKQTRQTVIDRSVVIFTRVEFSFFFPGKRTNSLLFLLYPFPPHRCKNVFTFFFNIFVTFLRF